MNKTGLINNDEGKILKSDLVIIGGGIIGASLAYELAKYNLNVIVLEKNQVVANETSFGNSGMIHGGFDAKPGTQKAFLNVEGKRIWTKEIFNQLSFPRKQANSLVIAFNKEEEEELHKLFQRGLQNGLDASEITIVSKSQLLEIEPNISHSAVAALVCTTSYLIDPVAATREMLSVAKRNGARVLKGEAVTKIFYERNLFGIVTSNDLKIVSKVVINAAGHYADEIAKLAGYPEFIQKTRRGEYRVLSGNFAKKFVNNVCFMVPTIHGKGVLVAPMLDGNILVGPTAQEEVPKDEINLLDKQNSKKLDELGKKMIPLLPMDKVIKQFAGSRPIDVASNDFVIATAKDNRAFINLGGMQSPALSAAPAIARKAVQLIRESGLPLVENGASDLKLDLVY